MTVDQHQRLALGLASLAVIPWLVSIVLPVASSASGNSSHGLVYLLFGWLQDGPPRHRAVLGWWGHFPAGAALALLALGSMRPWRLGSRLALWLACALAVCGLALASDSVWSFEMVRVLGSESGGIQWTAPAVRWEIGFYVWMTSFCLLVGATLGTAISALFVRVDAQTLAR